MNNVEKCAHLVSRRWYIQNFNASLGLIHFAGKSPTVMKNKLGYTYRAFIMEFENNLVRFAYDLDDLEYVAQEFEKHKKENPNYLKEIMKESDELEKQAIDFVSKHVNNLQDLSDEELILTYQELERLYSQSVGITHVIEGYSLTRDEVLKQELKEHLKRLGREDEFNHFFTKLTDPIRKFFITDYKNAIVLIANFIREKEELKKRFHVERIEDIEKLIKTDEKLHSLFLNLEKNFYWIKSNYKESPHATIKEFIVDVKNALIEDQREHVSDENFQKNVEIKNAVSTELQLPQKLVEIINITDIMTYWQDDRKKTLMKILCGMDLFLKEMAQRFNKNHHYLRQFLAEEMSVDVVKSAPESFFMERLKGTFVIYENGQVHVLVGKEYEEFKKLYHSKKEVENLSEIRGTVASVGKAQGKVKICKTLEDINNFQKGEVLVTGMTRPEFVPAMAKACAIVTDEGGITSHAAVISREFGTPCVIGTKHATTFFKDGDLVEVDANEGVVRKIS